MQLLYRTVNQMKYNGGSSRRLCQHFTNQPLLMRGKLLRKMVKKCLAEKSVLAFAVGNMRGLQDAQVLDDQRTFKLQTSNGCAIPSQELLTLHTG